MCTSMCTYYIRPELTVEQTKTITYILLQMNRPKDQELIMYLMNLLDEKEKEIDSLDPWEDERV